MKEKSILAMRWVRVPKIPEQNIRPERSGHVKVFNKQKSVLGRILTVTLNARAQGWRKEKKEKRLKSWEGGQIFIRVQKR